MADDRDTPTVMAPKTLADEQRMLKKGEANVTDDDIFGSTTKSDPHSYLGHLANDDVLRAGHNVGHKPKGTASSTGMAKKGHRVIPGTGANQIGHAKYGDAPTGLVSKKDRALMDAMPKMAAPMGMSFGRPEPVAKPDLKMSADHHVDSLDYHKRHGTDHADGYKKAAVRGDTKGMQFHADHMTEHTHKMREHTDKLKQRKRQLKGKK